LAALPLLAALSLQLAQLRSNAPLPVAPPFSLQRVVQTEGHGSKLHTLIYANVHKGVKIHAAEQKDGHNRAIYR
jgi:hypothetical protein